MILFSISQGLVWAILVWGFHDFSDFEFSRYDDGRFLSSRWGGKPVANHQRG